MLALSRSPIGKRVSCRRQDRKEEIRTCSKAYNTKAQRHASRVHHARSQQRVCRHEKVSEKLGVKCYFALPRHPWQRGTNENTNGLLREYFPKGKSIDNVSVKDIQAVYDKLNLRPRKRLSYRTPYEVYYGKTLRLI